MLESDFLSDLRKDGYVIIPGKFASHANRLMSDMCAILEGISSPKLYNSNESLQKNIEHIANNDRSIIGTLYDLSRTSFCGYQLLFEPTLHHLYKCYLGTENLSFQSNDYLVRIDLPKETSSLEDNQSMLLPWHQDFPYNQGSINSLTIYLPLQAANQCATLEIVPQSHKDGLLPHNYYKKPFRHGDVISEGHIYETIKKSFHNLEKRKIYLDYGDILIFDMNIVHRSSINDTGNARVNLQIRVSSLMDAEYVRRYSTIKKLRHRNLTSSQQSKINELSN